MRGRNVAHVWIGPDATIRPVTRGKLTNARPVTIESLQSLGVQHRTTKYRSAAVIFSQGDRAAEVMYLQRGSVKLVVLSSAGKEAIVSVLQPGDFFGEGCLAGQPRLLAHMLARNIRIEEDLVDQLFNSAEKRLARTLLLLARYGTEDGSPQRLVPKLSQEALADIVGTTRGRVSFFMNKFRKLGFIEYNGGIKVKPALLSIVLHN